MILMKACENCKWSLADPRYAKCYECCRYYDDMWEPARKAEVSE